MNLTAPISDAGTNNSGSEVVPESPRSNERDTANAPANAPDSTEVSVSEETPQDDDAALDNAGELESAEDSSVDSESPATPNKDKQSK